MTVHQHHIRCSEIWGGSCNADLDVCTSGVVASVFSAACEGPSGGDVYYFAVSDSDLLTRVVLADLRGHGHQVSLLSEWIFSALRDSMGSLDSGLILTNLNRLIFEKGLEAITTATIVSFYLGDSNLYVANAGHPPALLRKSHEQLWAPIEVESQQRMANLPLGMFRTTVYNQVSFPLRAGDRLALYTDGFVEATDSRDQEFGEGSLRASLHKYGNLELSALKEKLMSDLRRHVGGELEQDDVTLLLVEVAETSPAAACA